MEMQGPHVRRAAGRLSLLRRPSCAGVGGGFAASLVCARTAEGSRYPGGGALQGVIDRASAGDVVILAKPASTAVPFGRATMLTIRGEPGRDPVGRGKGASSRSGGRGRRAGAGDPRLGPSLEEMDAGIFVEQSAAGARGRGQPDRGQSLRHLPAWGRERGRAQQHDHRPRGGPPNEAGNGVSVWNAPGAKVLDNDVSFGRDGIFVITSKRNVFWATVSGTCASPSTTCTPTTARSRITCRLDNTVGYAIMFSDRLKIPTTCRMATATTACCSTTPTARRSPATWSWAVSSPPSAGRAGTRGKDGKRARHARLRR